MTGDTQSGSTSAQVLESLPPMSTGLDITGSDAPAELCASAYLNSISGQASCASTACESSCKASRWMSC